MSKEKIGRGDVSVERNHYGAVVCSAMVEGYRESKQYYGYSTEESIEEFLAEINEDED